MVADRGTPCSREFWQLSDDMKGALILFLAVSNAFRVTLIHNDLANYSFNETEIENMFSYAFKDSYCAEIFTDNAETSEHFIGILHKSLNAPSLITGLKNEVVCTDRIYVAQNLDTLWGLLLKNIARDVRFFIFLIDVSEDNLRSFLRIFQDESNIFEYSEGYIIELHDPRLAYKYNIVQNKFITESVSTIKSFENDIVEDFGGRMLKVSTFNCSIHSLVGPLDDKGRPAYIGGVELRFFDMLSKILNFTYKIKVPKNKNKYGNVAQNGSWRNYGVIGLVGAKEVDVGFCGIWGSSNLQKARIDLTASPTRMCVKFLVPKSEITAKRGKGLVMPFHRDVWILLSVVVVLVPLCLKIFSHLIRVNIMWEDNKFIRGYTCYVKSFLLVWGLLLTNPPKSFEKFGPLKHIISSWALIGLLTATFYSCSLRSSLLMISREKNVDTIEEMVKSKLIWSLDYRADFEFLFNMDDFWHIEWAKKFKTASLQKQCDLIKSKKVAILANIHDEIGGATTHQELPCTKYLENYRTSVECLVKLNTAFILQYKSPYTKPFTKYIQKFHEHGGFTKEYSDHFHKLSLKERYVLQPSDGMQETFQSKETKLGMYNMISSMILVLIGNASAFLVFISEMLWHNRRKIYKKLLWTSM